MAKDQLDSYYSALLEKWQTNLKLSVEFSGSKTIHDLRVDTKRIRALLKLAQIVSPDFSATDALRSLKKPFRSAGLIRHYQVQMELTKRSMDDLGLKLDWYYNLLKSQEIGARRQFKSKCSNFDSRFLDRSVRLLRRSLADQDRNELSTKIGRHVEQLLAKLRASDLSSGVDTDYHALRILAKETRYSLEILREYAGDNKFLEKIDAGLLGLHQALGAWHDFDLACKDLEMARLAHITDSGICADSLIRFSSVLATERDLQLELFRSRWIDFVGPGIAETKPAVEALNPTD